MSRPAAHHERPIGVGEPAPDFTLSDCDGNSWSLSAHLGRFVVIFFYPEDDTPTCTKEACDFRDASGALSSTNAVVIGISPDGADAHRAFSDKFALNFPLLCDDRSQGTPKVCELFGVWRQKLNFGHAYHGVVRTTYLISPEGTVIRRWDRVRVQGHATAVLNAITGREAAATPLIEVKPLAKRAVKTRRRKPTARKPARRAPQTPRSVQNSGARPPNTKASKKTAPRERPRKKPANRSAKKATPAPRARKAKKNANSTPKPARPRTRKPPTTDTQS